MLSPKAPNVGGHPRRLRRASDAAGVGQRRASQRVQSLKALILVPCREVAYPVYDRHHDHSRLLHPIHEPIPEYEDPASVRVVQFRNDPGWRRLRPEMATVPAPPVQRQAPRLPERYPTPGSPPARRRVVAPPLCRPLAPRLLDAESPDFDRLTATWITDPLNPATARGALGRDWSVIDLSVPQTSAWMRSGAAVPAERLRSLQVESRALGETLEVKVYLPPGFADDGREDYPALLLFDGLRFFDIDRLHMLVEQLVQDGAIEPVVTAFVYNPDATRNRDMSCYPPTHRFLADELLPLLRERFRAARSPARTILAGRSRSALAAACAAYTMPGEIGNVISQSGAFWLAP